MREFLILFTDLAAELLQIGLLLLVIRSWFSPGRPRGIFRFLAELFGPALARIRRAMPDLGGLDFSPIVLFFLIEGVRVGVRELARFL